MRTVVRISGVVVWMCMGVAQGQDHRLTLDAVREIVARNEALLNPIKMSYSIRIERPGDFPGVAVGGIMPSGRPWAGHRVVWAQDGARQYIQRESFYEANKPAGGEVVVLDGSHVTSARLPDLANGGIHPRATHDGYFCLAQMLQLRPFEGRVALKDVLRPEVARLHGQAYLVGDRRACMVDVTDPAMGPFMARFWIDLEAGVPLRVAYYDEHPDFRGARIRAESKDIRLRRLPNGGWIPVSGTRSVYFRGGEVGSDHLEVDIGSITVDRAQIPASLFEIDFPLGAKVSDAVSGIIHTEGQRPRTFQETMETADKDKGIDVPLIAIQGDAYPIRWSWAARTLPWLILTDKEHEVVAEGLAPGDLEKELAKLGGRSWGF